MGTRYLHADTDSKTLYLEGDWVTAHLKDVDAALTAVFDSALEGSLTLDCEGVQSLDTSGAYLLHQLCLRLKDKEVAYDLRGLSPAHQDLLKQVAQNTPDQHSPFKQESPETLFLLHLGQKTHHLGQEVLLLLSFLGEVCLHLMRLFLRPRTFKGTSLVVHLHKVGLQALPIVGLISFLIGIVLVYQGAQQLKRFGAEIFTIDLLAVSVLREIGILLTSIVVAGRSGSAFTAQIGTMSLNQEIDAMRVMGLDPTSYLVLPRLLALLIALPLLGSFANIMALLGGALMGTALIGVDFPTFFQHLSLTIQPWTFWTGMIKAPVFAFVIALVGCFEGLRVAGGAESVGHHTTKSVVKSIFLVIVLDALFSIFYAFIGI